MEILRKFKENGYFTSELFLLLNKKKMVHPSEQIVPSIYMKEVRMSCADRLKNLNNMEIDNIVKTGGQKAAKPVLEFFPRILIFQNFKPNDRVVAKFSVKNISNNPTFLNMVYKESSYFFIKPVGSELLSRLAPGISVTFAITFEPPLYEDYVHRVTFHTDIDQYVIALIAVGPRPIVTFPDEIIIPEIPLKVENSVEMILANRGKVPAGFTLNTQCPFSVSPKSAYLTPSTDGTFKVAIKTMHFGEVTGMITAVFESGETFRIDVKGKTTIVRVELEKATVRFLDTYNTMVCQQNYKIINRSNYLITYSCMKNESVYYDFEEKIKLATKMYDLKETESMKYTKLVRYDVATSDQHERVYTRIFYDEIQTLVVDETLRFQNMHFSITPITGCLWPNETTELTVTFAPKEIGQCEALAYLDIDGIKHRVPLKMVGTSLPPRITLNCETLDMDKIYINKNYNYEIVAVNNGHINGVIVYDEKPTLFSTRITCTPELHCLKPGEKEIFTLSFCNPHQGPYFEEINFIIRDTKVVLKLYLKGEVVYPSLIFSEPCLDFGDINVGVPKTLMIEIVNESVANVQGILKIASDGPEIDAMTLEDIDACCADIKLPLQQWPREFRIVPDRLKIESESRMSIKVTLTANIARTNRTQLELELERSHSPPIVLPVLFNATVPKVVPAPDINLRACFVDYVNHETIVLKTSGGRGFFSIEEPESPSTIDVNVEQKRGFIENDCTITIPITVRTETLGLQEYSLRMLLFGSPHPFEVCHIAICGVRPIVTCTPMSLQWGQIKLLTKVTKTLTLFNDSTVRVYFRTSVMNKDGRWSIIPTEGFIEPESETELTVTVCLLNAANYYNKALIQCERVKDIVVAMSAVGVGTSIVVGEEQNKISLGLHFTKIPMNCKVNVKNCGTRLHNLEWSDNFKTSKGKASAPPPIPPFFNLEPRVFRLLASEKMELTITAMSAKAGKVEDTWYLVGSVEGVNRKEILLECQVTAEFVDPKIIVSATQINLQYDYGPYNEFYRLTDLLTIKNVSRLPLDLQIQIRPPFALVAKQGSYKIPPEEEHLCGCITYTESDLKIQEIIEKLGKQKSRDWIDCLTLKPVQPMHKNPLDFFEDINKIKLAFHMTYSIEQRLEDQEIIKIQIVMDTTKHTNLKSKIYSEVMKIKFKGHKNKDFVKIVGKINFPNVLIMTPKVDFNCIVNGSTERKSFKIQNSTPLVDCFRFQWRKCNITTLPMPNFSNNLNEVLGPSSKTYQSFSVSEHTHSSVHASPAASVPVQSGPIRSQIEQTPDISTINEHPSSLHVQNLNIKSSTNEVVKAEMDVDLLKKKILQKITPMLPPETDTGFPWAHKFPKLEKFEKYNINDLLQVVPHRGMLPANGTQYIHIIFRPTSYVNIRAVLECDVLGGPPETILVTGQSSDLIFTLNTRKLNFRIRSFHESATEKLILTNIAYLPFAYKTYLNEPIYENELNGTICNLEPSENTLDQDEVAEINVVVKSGVVGFFNRTFILEIGHLPHIPIEVYGWGVIPQIYLTLPRPDIHKLHCEVGYKAISTLTEEYLLAHDEIYLKGLMGTEHMNSPRLDTCFEDPMFQFGWHICSDWDGYPSLMDIELAIERWLVMNHLKQRPEILTQYSNHMRSGSIPNFNTIPYICDFGVVITGSTINCVIEVLNYGPVTTKLLILKNSSPIHWLNTKLCGKLTPGETGKLEITFSPDTENFKELEQNVETHINIEIPYGVLVPVKVKALVAVPYLKANVSKIDLGKVRCGDKLVCTVPIKNVGRPACIWFATLKLKTLGPNPMAISETSGKYEAEEGGFLSLSFTPIVEMVYHAMIIFRFHMNPTKLIIPVVGQGILPQVHVIGPNINFPPTLPWADTTHIYFGFTNPCPFPIELIIAHTDEKWLVEEEIMQLLSKYYNRPDEMLVPAIKPGAGLPPEIIHFFTNFKENVRKTLEEEIAASTKPAAQSKSIAPRGSRILKSVRSPKQSGKSGTLKDILPTRKFRTEIEIIADEIKDLRENGVDPLKESLQAMEVEPKEDESAKMKGLLLIFHGSPCEETFCKEMAYRAGIELKLPTVSFDMCFIEALCVCEGPAQNVLMMTINEIYEANRKTRSDYMEEEENFGNLHEDEFDKIQGKLEFVTNLKALQIPKKGGDKKKLNEKSVDQSTTVTAIPPAGSPYLFQIDFIQELMTEFFSLEKFTSGFIIDSLSSNIIKVPPLLLTTVLKCKPEIRNIHLVLCHLDFTKWLHSYEEKQREIEAAENVQPKEYSVEEIQEIIEKFQEMDAGEYENADPKEKAIFIQHGLEERRQKRTAKLIDETKEHKEKPLKKGKEDDHVDHDQNIDTKKKLPSKRDEAKGKTNLETVGMSTKYNDYMKNTHEQLVNIANNWVIEECDLGYPLFTITGQLVGSAPKKNKKKSELQIQNSELVRGDGDRGFPLTFITCPCLHYKHALIYMLKKSPIVQNALKKETEIDILTLPVVCKQYTVLLPKTMPAIQEVLPLKWLFLNEKPLKKCDCSQITDLLLLDDTTPENVFNILSKWTCTCGKRVASSQTSTSEIPSISVERISQDESDDYALYPLNSIKSVPGQKERFVLMPFDLLRCKYEFNPQEEGFYSVKRYVEVFGWPGSRVDITVTGISDLPRLDSRPKKMFKHFVRRTVEDKVYKQTFLDDLKLFEFGPIFMGANRVYEEEDTIHLKNCSLMLAEVTVEFEDYTNVFMFDKACIRLEPGGRDNLVLTAAPNVVGVHTSQLLFCIKDNPEIIKVTIACTGVVPIVEILPLTKMIDYGKLLLFRRADDRFIVKNGSILPITWKVRNTEEFVENFIISRTSGTVPRYDNQVVPITYIACSVGVITNRALIIDVYDELGRGEPMVIECLFLSAECYDVMLDCVFQHPKDTSLNFGNVKVNSEVWADMHLLNRGKYPIYFKLKKVKHFPDPALLKTFVVRPEHGVVPPTLKLTSIEFECKPSMNVKLVNVPAYTCMLLDGSKDQVVVAKFPVCVTIASFFNTFTLFPLGELNFGIISVGSGIARDIIITNTSKCPFAYDIWVPEKYRVEEAAAVASSKPAKETKIKVPPIKCGNFIIMNTDNLLAPGASRTIPIQFLASSSNKFEETIHFHVTDTCPAEASGVPFRLVGMGAVPALDFWDVDTTFREHILVRSLSDYKSPQSVPHCVFAEDTVTLYFYSVIINTTYRASLDLYNNGLVPSFLNAKISYQSNTNDKIFSCEKYSLHIDPLMHRKFTLIFSPKELTEYRAVLDLRLKLLDNKEQSFKVCMVGYGAIPRITLVTPEVIKYRQAVLNFPMTSLGAVSTKQVMLKNISPLKTVTTLNILRQNHEDCSVFTIVPSPISEAMLLSDSGNNSRATVTMIMDINEEASIDVHFNPLLKGRTSCEIKLSIKDNPYEYFTYIDIHEDLKQGQADKIKKIKCQAEAFIEDVMLVGLEMLSMEIDMDAFGADSTVGASIVEGAGTDARKKKSATSDKKAKSKIIKKIPSSSTYENFEPSEQKYVLDFGGCELFTMHKRTVIMVNNSEKIYSFEWLPPETIIIKPYMGYISPGEEKDLEIIFFSPQPVVIKKELLICNLIAIGSDILIMDMKGPTWDNRQTITQFSEKREFNAQERLETALVGQKPHQPDDILGTLHISVYVSAVTEYTKYTTTLENEINLEDTFNYQNRTFEFEVTNKGRVPMKINWHFCIEQYPTRTDKPVSIIEGKVNSVGVSNDESVRESINIETCAAEGSNEFMSPEAKEGESKITLFSGSEGRQSVDTWFDVDLPFKIVPNRDCLTPEQTKTFKITFNPQDAFDFEVRLRSTIDNLDPYDHNINCKITARSLVPVIHLDHEESDYLISGRRKKERVMTLPPHMQCLEFNVLGAGCYKKVVHIVNPTSEGYEYVIENILEPNKKDLVPVHCNLLKGYVEGGTSQEVIFTFAPSTAGMFESQWKFHIAAHTLSVYLMVVGCVREPNVEFIPGILVIENTIVGFSSCHYVMLKNHEENDSVTYRLRGDSLCNDTGKRTLVIDPEKGILKPLQQQKVRIIYTPITDGPTSFKIFYAISHLMRDLTLCVNALSYSISPVVTYDILGNEHLLSPEAINNIHLDQTASTYDRVINFNVRNNGSATFRYQWIFNCSNVKKYLNVWVDPDYGFLGPGNDIKCELHFTLKKVEVQAFPVDLQITNGPKYEILLHSEIEKPLYHFSCKILDFGKCFINAPELHYKKNFAFTNDDGVSITLDMTTMDFSELFVDFRQEPIVEPKERVKIPIYFRPKAQRKYEFRLQFWVNSLCEEIVIVRGEGTPLLVDLYEGCEKSFYLGPVEVGKKVIREILLMNHSKIPVEAKFLFIDALPVSGFEDAMALSEGSSICLNPSNTNVLTALEPGQVSRVKQASKYHHDRCHEQEEKDCRNSLASVKVIPSVLTLQPLRRVALKIHYKPVDLITTLTHVVLSMKVFHIVKPLVVLTGCATGYRLAFNQNSLQFGKVRKCGMKQLKVMLMNQGDYSAKFCFQPLTNEDFTISPMAGHVGPKSNCLISVTFKPVKFNPFIKLWAICNIVNYKPLELSLYAACTDGGTPQTRSLFMECPVRESKTDYMVLTNPTEETWEVFPEIYAPFQTLRTFQVLPGATFDVPITFKPLSVGTHEVTATFSPLGESALFVQLIGAATHPYPAGTIDITVEAKVPVTEELLVRNVTEKPESYVVGTELVKVVPDKFDGFYDVKSPESVKVWGDASAICRWTFVCYEPCEMTCKVTFVDEETREYQYYIINLKVTSSQIAGTLKFVARAREISQQEIVIKNPLPDDSDFHVHCEKLNHSETIRIQRHSQARCMLTYSPLVIGDGQDDLTISNHLTGQITYRVLTRCLPAEEKIVECTTSLGNSIPIRLRVKNKNESKADFAVTTTHPSIQLEKDYVLPPGERGKFLVWFEPTELGLQECTVTFTSAVAGEFVFVIKGTATEPKPLGPLNIKPGSFATIKFKNVFDTTVTFKLIIDNEQFYIQNIKEAFEKIRSKKDIKIQVYLRDKPVRDADGKLPTGCLTIEPAGPDDPQAQWYFFLQGV